MLFRSPRPKDQDGLSFFTYPSYGAGNYTVTTIELVNSTPDLKVECDTPVHCVIKPKFGNINDWISTKLIANDSPHRYTISLKSISWVEIIK